MRGRREKAGRIADPTPARLGRDIARGSVSVDVILLRRGGWAIDGSTGGVGPQ